MTFWRAQERARQDNGTLVLRIEDLDRDRCRSNFREAIFEDLRWFGLEWEEGPDPGGAPLVPICKASGAIVIWPRGKNCAPADLFTRALVPGAMS